jgi:hypothetical protein
LPSVDFPTANVAYCRIFSIELLYELALVACLWMLALVACLWMLALVACFGGLLMEACFGLLIYGGLLWILALWRLIYALWRLIYALGGLSMLMEAYLCPWRLIMLYEGLL